MSCETNKPCCGISKTCCIYVVGILGAIGIGYGTVRMATRQVTPTDLTAQRVAERLKFRQEVADATTATLTNAAVVDPARGFYRLPVNVAMELAVREWQNPAAARKTLLDRLEKSTAKLPDPFE
jgi:hypothetical protein